DEFDELAFLDEAIDAVLGGAAGGLAELAESYGLRQAIAASVQALRLAGIDAPAIDRARFRDEDKRAQIARILDEYEARLRRASRVDAAGVYRTAGEALTLGTAAPAPAHYLLLPGLGRRGLAGVMLDALLERGAVLLPADPVHGLPWPDGWLGSAPPPAPAATALSWIHDVAAAPRSAGGVTLELFAASSITSELREVLRRAIDAGLHWDQVEIIATDAQAYGVALDGIARRLGIAVTYAVGLPLARTRPGRAVVKYLEWLEADFPADLLRQMLERGDVVPPPGAPVSGTALARRLRRLRIGRGRAGYERAFARRARALEAPQGADDERTPAEFAEQRARERAELAALRELAAGLLAAAPALDGRGEDAELAPAELARSLRALLERVPAITVADRTAHGRMCERLERLAATAVRRTSLRAATAIVLAKLDERVPAPDATGSAPWASAGGHLHLADLDHGGWSGRAATFIVGLDAGRFPGGGGSDALLVDDDRRRLTLDQRVPGLPTAMDRLVERRYALAQLLARLRGRVTLSYAAWDAVEGRATAPASELLQAFRLQSGQASADYDALHHALEPAASPVPRTGALLDADDAWLAALAHPGGLRYGVPAVIALHPELAAGVHGYAARRGPPSAHHGLVRPRRAFDPRDDAAHIVSATQLQTLGSCPLRYLLYHVLGVRAPDDPELATEYWLSPLDRGSLMHAVYERALREARDAALDLESAAFEKCVLAIADARLAALRAELPPPGEAIFALEREGVLEDARAFVAMVREDGGAHIALEQKFGREGEPPVPVTLPDGRVLHLTGAIDRIDRLADGRLVVIDYKTGSRTRFGGRHGAFDGGRRLQHVLYAAVARALHGAEVARAEYHFPTRRNENHRARFGPQELRDGLAVVSELLELAARGQFVPTTDPDDCRICEHAATCRVRVDGYGRVASPPASWAREADADALDVLRRLRH
ncbi:MAG TPA: PD-(D/E)XK nuclease family protein, partial [Longimicrobiales bacterium]|nr:PD-(D/E)XK nuclease family protein [Longimicrobiales bacterium]